MTGLHVAGIAGVRQKETAVFATVPFNAGLGYCLSKGNGVAAYWQFPLAQETTRVAVAVLVRAGLVLVPVTVKTLEVDGAAVVVVTVSVEEAAVAGFGLKVPLAPVPRPLTENVTAPVKPPVRVMLTV